MCKQCNGWFSEAISVVQFTTNLNGEMSEKLPKKKKKKNEIVTLIVHRNSSSSKCFTTRTTFVKLSLHETLITDVNWELFLFFLFITKVVELVHIVRFILLV